ncbi:MAG: cytochrome c [Microscillaceae bacterium]|nr:cytochrome c [Microscillaceae bacterium]
MEMAKQSSEAQADGSALSSEEKAQIESGKGVGEIKEVKLSDPLDEQMVKTGISVYEMKCASCHKLDDQRTVGPGWKGVTNKRRPEWIMNMVTNVEVMLDEDPTAQKLLEECLTRMPNQGLAVGDARNVLEFMRKNDVEKAGSKDGALK